jgi:anti-sigma B factor antagonist
LGGSIGRDGAERESEVDEGASKRLGLRRESVEVLLRKYEEWKPPSPKAAVGMFEVTSGRAEDTIFIAASGELDYTAVDGMEKEIRTAEKSDASRIVVSLQDVTYMDSSGLNMLLQARVRMRGNPQRLRFLASKHEAVAQLLDATQTASALY